MMTPEWYGQRLGRRLPEEPLTVDLVRRSKTTVGLDRDQARALVAAAGTGAQALRTAAVVRLLLHNALRVDEACAADIADLGEDSGHRVLRVVRKGARKATIPLTPATVAALEALPGRPGAAGRSGRLAAADRAAAGHRHRRKALPGPPVGTGAPPGPHGQAAHGNSSRCSTTPSSGKPTIPG